MHWSELSTPAKVFVGIVALFASAYLIGMGSNTNGSGATRPEVSSSVPEEKGRFEKVDMKLRNFWNYEWDRWKGCQAPGPFCGEAFFECDYTSRTCQRGYRFGGFLFIFTTLTEDRITELAHLVCREDRASPTAPPTEECLSFDTGQARGKFGGIAAGRSLPNYPFALDADMPDECVDFTRNRNSRLASCDQWVSQHLNPAGLGILAFRPAR